MPFARLPSKPSVQISYSVSKLPSATGRGAGTPRIIVFINNLLLPASSWAPTLEALRVNLNSSSINKSDGWADVLLLTYDRFGQGLTIDRDPLDQRPEAESGYGHDFLDVSKDLRELIDVVVAAQGDLETAARPELLLVGASIGGPIARLFAQSYPELVTGIIILDSNICNANYSEFWPNPDSSDLDPDQVTAPDCSLQDFIRSAKRLAALFDLDVKNKECLDRRTSALLLPFADKPLLRGPNGMTTKICIIGHDPDTFAQEGQDRMQTPVSFTKRWIQPRWDKYNLGLLQIGDHSEFPDVVIAPGCGHFIQQDNPVFVADQLRRMMEVLHWFT